MKYSRLGIKYDYKKNKPVKHTTKKGKKIDIINVLLIILLIFVILLYLLTG